jgi:hypothetical protein
VSRWITVAALLGGCDAAWNLDPVHDPPDAPPCALDDEDCDQRANATDLCPADVDTAADDLDVDGIGNACDPERMIAGDHRVVFDGFVDNSLGWAIDTGMWTVGDGVATTPKVGDGRLYLTASAKLPSVRAVFDELVTINNGRAGVFTRQGISYVTCTVVGSPAGAEFVRIEGPNLGIDRPLSGSGPIFLEGGQLRDGSLYCRAHHGEDPDVQATTVPAVLMGADRFGLMTSSASASFKSVMLLDVP